MYESSPTLLSQSLSYIYYNLYFQTPPDTEISIGASPTGEDMKGLNARARAILRAERDSQKSQYSVSAGSL